MNKDKKITLKLQLLLTLVVLVFVIISFFFIDCFSYLEIFLGLDLLLMAINNQKYYQRKIMTYVDGGIGIIILILGILSACGVIL